MKAPLLTPTLCQVKVAEFGIDWALKVAPMDGWPAVSDDFWRQLLLLGNQLCGTDFVF